MSSQGLPISHLRKDSWTAYLAAQASRRPGWELPVLLKAMPRTGLMLFPPYPTSQNSHRLAQSLGWGWVGRETVLFSQREACQRIYGYPSSSTITCHSSWPIIKIISKYVLLALSTLWIFGKYLLTYLLNMNLPPQINDRVEVESWFLWTCSVNSHKSLHLTEPQSLY